MNTALSPLPIPKNALPLDSSDKVIIALATTVGWRVMGFVTVGPRKTLSVFKAQAAKQEKISLQRKWESAGQTACKPNLSARTAILRVSDKSVGKKHTPNLSI
jgi:hypothetical protein